MERSGANPHMIHAQGWDPTWSPDGMQILFASNMAGANQLFVMDANGVNVRRVTDFDSLRGRSDWSPDGAWMVTYNGQPWKREVFIFRPDFSDLRQLTPEGGNSQGPSFSPDGTWVVFTSYFDHYGDDLGCEIYIIRVDGTDLRRLTDNVYCDYQPRWGP
jgi:Tol biopolymer transport system component